MPRPTYRIKIHGRHIEGRLGDFGGEFVSVDGRVASERRLTGWLGLPHRFRITDEQGRERGVEVRWSTSRLNWRTLMPVMEVHVDGEFRCWVKAAHRQERARCYWCGYELRGLELENGEVRCPECGRHTRETELGGPLSGES
jgi:hypothetical protein